MQDLLSAGAVRARLSAEMPLAPSRRFLLRLVSQLQGLLNDPIRYGRRSSSAMPSSSQYR